jgi:hypothetical protein
MTEAKEQNDDATPEPQSEEPQLKKMTEAEEQNEDTAPVSRKEEPPLKWLYDRIKGNSKVGTSRPPHPMCFVPPPVGRYARVARSYNFEMIRNVVGSAR